MPYYDEQSNDLSRPLLKLQTHEKTLYIFLRRRHIKLENCVYNETSSKSYLKPTYSGYSLNFVGHIIDCGICSDKRCHLLD